MYLSYNLCFPGLAGSALSMFLSWETSQFPVQIHPSQLFIRRAEQIPIPDKLKLGPALHFLPNEIFAALWPKVSLLATNSFSEGGEMSCVETRAPSHLSWAGSWSILYYSY